jgi:predicted Zn-dependent protease
MPEGWKVQRGETAGTVVAQDPSQQYLAQVIPLELKQALTPLELAASVERNSGLQPYGAAWITVDGEQVYQADYKAQLQTGGQLRVRIAYITREKKGFIAVNIAGAQAFPGAEKTFNTVISSFHHLTAEEAERIPLARLKVYMVKGGDTYRSISARFYHTERYADDIKQFNGMDELDVPPAGTLIKIKPLIPGASEERK